MMTRSKIIVLLVFIISFVSSVVFAGAATFVDEQPTSKFYRWKDGVIPVYFDPGDLTIEVDHAEAREMVTDAWNIWMSATLDFAVTGSDAETVKVAGVEFEYMGKMSTDINETNYRSFYDTDEAYDKYRPTVIIFDEGGTILQDLEFRMPEAYANADSSVLGVTNLYSTEKVMEGDVERLYINNGTILLNGKLYASKGKAAFKAAILHELGHLMNLDHSALNDECYEDEGCAAGDDGWKYLPTMFRYIVSVNNEYGNHPQLDLHRDDKSWAAWLFRAQNNKIDEDFCQVRGELFDLGGRGFQGAQITVREAVDNQYNNANTAISGGFYPACTESGKYIVMGLVPNRTYEISYQRIPNWCVIDGKELPPGTCGLGSGINPYAPPRPVPDPASITVNDFKEFYCTEGGEIIEADKTYIAADLSDDEYKYYNIGGYEFSCDEAGNAVEVPADDGGTTSYSGLNIKKKGWCSLVSVGSFDWTVIFFIFPAIGFFVVRRKFK